MSRTQNTLRNISASLGGQLLNNFLRWICRVVFIYTLGKEYLGISSLYVNILTILSLSELGLGSAITYSLYRPLAEQDIESVKSQMQFFKNAYRVIGICILAIGLCLIPFLPVLMKGSTDAVNIYEYYFLYLMQSVVSYLFFAYKGILLNADQKKYIGDMITYLTQVIMNVVQILVLILLRSFFLYTILAILFEIIRNAVIALAVDRRYPYLKEKAVPLSKEERRSIFQRVYAMSLYKVASVVGTSTDNLVISANISVIFVGLYNNYYMIIQVIEKILSGIFQGFTASLGNYFVTENLEENEKMFRVLNRLNLWAVTFCSVSFAVLLQPFIGFCFGSDYLLEYTVVIVIVLNFATNYQNLVVQIYKNVTGLFVKGRYRAVATAVLNLIISIILVRRIGLAGVFLGSIISRLVTTWWYDAWLIYRHAFHKSPIGFYLDGICMVLLIGANTALVELVCQHFQDPTLLSILIRGACCLIIPNAVLFLIYGRTEEIRYVLKRGKGRIQTKFLRR